MRKDMRKRLYSQVSENKCPECRSVFTFWLEEIDEEGHQYGTYVCGKCGYEEVGSF